MWPHIIFFYAYFGTLKQYMYLYFLLSSRMLDDICERKTTVKTKCWKKGGERERGKKKVRRRKRCLVKNLFFINEKKTTKLTKHIIHSFHPIIQPLINL